jgi:GT2 family glycosyltransferase
MILDIVVVSWNVRDLLARCLESLLSDLDSTTLASSRIVVVDNASRDGSAEMIRSRFPRVELIVSERNLGFAVGNNVGLQALGYGASDDASDSEAVLLLNPDAEVLPGTIRALLEALRSLPDAAVITARLSYSDGAFQHSAFRFPGLAQLFIDLFPVPARLHASRLNGRYPRRLYDSGQPFEIDHPLGAVMLLRTEAIRQVGLFDEGFELYCEEIDWCARFKKDGWRNYCAPAAHVVHHSGQSTSQVRVEAFVKLWTARHQLHARHPDFAPMWLAKRIVRAGIRRKMRGASPEMQAACQKIIAAWK